MGDEEFEEFEVRCESAPARPIDFAIVGVDLVRHCVSAVEEALTGVMSLMCSHANHMTDQRIFEDEARAAIESLTQQEE